MKGLIVVYYDGEAEQWNFAFISDDKVLFRGTVARAQGTRAEGIVEVESDGVGNFGHSYTQHNKFRFDEFWADCEGHNREIMTKLVYAAYPEAKITGIINI